MTENKTNDDDKCISLNVRFFLSESCPKDVNGCIITFVVSCCSLSWVLKVGAVDSAVYEFLVTACQEDVDGLGAWCRL